MRYLSLILFVLAIGGCSMHTGSNVAVNSSVNTSAAANKDPETPPELPRPVSAQLTPAQQAIADKATEVKWDEQNISWRLSSDWKKVTTELPPDRTIEYHLP